MPSNRGVAYVEPGRVEVVDIDFPELVLKDGPGVHPSNVGRHCPHGAILKWCPPTSAAATSTWCVAARPRRPG
jgi:hypothetical protein